MIRIQREKLFNQKSPIYLSIYPVCTTAVINGMWPLIIFDNSAILMEL